VSVVKKPDDGYFMYYTANSPPNGRVLTIGLAVSDDGISWKRYGYEPLLDSREDVEWEKPFKIDGQWMGGIHDPSVIYDYQERTYKMWYAAEGFKDGVYGIRMGYAYSEDGIEWIRFDEPVFEPDGQGSWDDLVVGNGHVLRNSQGEYHLFYMGRSESDAQEGQKLKQQFPNLYYETEGSIGHAYSKDGMRWQRNPDNPIVTSSSGDWDNNLTFGPSALYLNDKIYLWYFGVKGVVNGEFNPEMDNMAYIGLARAPIYLNED